MKSHCSKTAYLKGGDTGHTVIRQLKLSLIRSQNLSLRNQLHQGITANTCQLFQKLPLTAKLYQCRKRRNHPMAKGLCQLIATAVRSGHRSRLRTCCQNQPFSLKHTLV